MAVLYTTSEYDYLPIEYRQWSVGKNLFFFYFVVLAAPAKVSMVVRDQRHHDVAVR